MRSLFPKEPLNDIRYFPAGSFWLVVRKFVACFFFCLLIWTYRFYRFSNLSYLLIAAFMMLHTIGAHYSYETPFSPFLNNFLKIWTYFFTVFVILAMGAFYELIEMWVSNLVAPGQGALFIGLQGDSWDTQHDISSAMYGAIITMTVTAIVKYYLITSAKKKGRRNSHAYTYQTPNK